jgi:serine/threonine protein phosphatase PrpC
VWGSLSDEEFREQLARPDSPEDISCELVQRAIRAGSRDNVTALVVSL